MNEVDNWEYPDSEEKPDEEAEPELRFEIMNYPADTTLQGYKEMDDRGELKTPVFQRSYVWDRVRASKLIESFLLGLPVPGVFLFRERNKPSYMIVDGQQRIKSVVAYINGEFNDRIFRLKNVATKWNGKRFTDLTDEDQFRLKGAVLRSTIIQQIDPDDNSSIYQIFERLNTGGVNLSPMEIRQCVSYGPFIEHLKELNKELNWRLILGKKKIDNRLRDVEIILRCFALQIKGSAYDKPMKGFLNDYAELERKNSSDYEVQKTRFNEVCAAVIKQMGEKPFHLRGRLNYGLLDAIMSTLLNEVPLIDLYVKKEQLLDNENFMNAITRNTSDVAEVKTRLQISYDVLK